MLLMGMLLISILTNMILATQLYFPQALHQMRLAFIAPPKLKASDHTRGPADTKTTLIVYTNYECSYCAKLNHDLLILMKELDFRLVYRHFSDADNRPLSFKAATAVECASDQNQFWAYNDKLFQHKQTFDNQNLQNIALQLNLDSPTFQQCINTEKYSDKIIAQKKQADTKKISATPTFFINGKRHEGWRPIEEMKQLLAIN